MSSYDIPLDYNINGLEDKILSLNEDYQILFKLNFNNFGNTNLLLYKVDDYSANLIDTIINMKKDLVDIDINVLKQKKIIKNKLASEYIDIQNQKAILEKTISDLEIGIIEFDKLVSELYSLLFLFLNLKKLDQWSSIGMG